MAVLPRAKTDTTPKHILVVEDDVVIRLVLADALRDAGLHVIEASSGAKAMSYLEAGGHVDLIFSDIDTGGAVDGLQLARNVRAAHRAIPVILTTGSARPSALQDAAAFIPKPYRIACVLELVSGILGLKGSATA